MPVRRVSLLSGGSRLVQAVGAAMRRARRRSVFADFHRRNKWRGEESRSGTGSDPAQTATIEVALSALLRELDVRRVLDVPCGDFAWMQRVDLDGMAYVGGDIVSALVEANQRRHGGPGIQFRVIDLVGDALPPADLLLCRDCLVHLPLRDAVTALRAIASADVEHVLLTTFPERSVNTDIAVGKWRPLNLEREPFNLPAPLKLITEKCTERDGRFADKALGLWRRADLAAALGRTPQGQPSPIRE